MIWLQKFLLASFVSVWLNRPPRTCEAVLRYPDASFESRSPLHIDECGSVIRGGSMPCLIKLKAHLLEDADCNRVICDNIATSTPVEVYANVSDWVPYKNFCGNLRELFVALFDFGIRLLEVADIGSSIQDTTKKGLFIDAERNGSSCLEAEKVLREQIDVFMEAYRTWSTSPADQGAPAYANTTRSVLLHHAKQSIAALSSITEAPKAQRAALPMLEVAVAVARRLHLLIENFSVNLLINYHVAQLEHNGRVRHGKNLLYEWYGDVSLVRVMFHEVHGKRWDALSFLLESLGVSEAGRSVAMAEIGVEAANTSQRLLERNPRLFYVGVDPYVRNDALYEDVLTRLAPFQTEGRFTLHRSTSIEAAKTIADGSLDLVFLDARHDYEAVTLDMAAWQSKLRAGGIMSGHDFSWMFPTVAMAVYKAAFAAPENTIHLAPDGVWWFSRT